VLDAGPETKGFIRMEYRDLLIAAHHQLPDGIIVLVWTTSTSTSAPSCAPSPVPRPEPDTSDTN
jgi:hypothetical protein